MAVNNNFYFRHYTNKDGLSHNTVYHSIQDKRGFMWFATEDGLNRFDGQNFIVYRNNSWQENSGLPHNHILSLFEDSMSRIWICTNAGTCYFDYETNLFYPLNNLIDLPVKETFRQCVEDGKGNLWLMGSSCILKTNINAQSITRYDFDYPIHIATTEDGSVAIADLYDIHLYQPDLDQFTIIPILKKEKEDNHISVIKEVPNGGFLIGSNNTGLKMYYSGTGKVETIIQDIQIRDILHYQANTYWIASESGIYIYNMIDKSIVNLRKSLTNEYTIADNAVYTLSKDSEGGIWLGSFFGGVDYLPNNYQNFRYYIGGKTHPGMLGNTIREICPDKYGNLWLGTEDNGINRFNVQTGEMINYSLNNPHHKLSATNIHGLYPKGDTLWIGTYNRGIDLLHIPSGKVIKRYDQANTHHGLISNFILCFIETTKGEFLIGTSIGVISYNPEKDNFTRWHNVPGLIRQIHEDRKGRIWIASSGRLRKFGPVIGKDSIIDYPATDISSSNGLGSNNITSVFEDSKGRIWVTTAYGFSLYDEKNDSFNRITTQNGLPSNFIYRIVEDETGHFWISTANGLVRYNPENSQIRIFTHKDGLHESQFNYSSSYKADDGTIYMGTIDGMISFTPRLFKEDTFSPPLYITRVYIPDNPLKNVPVQTSANNIYQLKLPYNTSTFAISYIAPSFTSPQTIHYSYMLEGIDKDWIDMGITKEVTFANLSPGKYTFRVRSTNSSQVWQENEQFMQIIITPPLWATSWAYIFYLLLLTSCAILFYRYKKARLLDKQQREKEIFENEKEKELYNAKIQFFTFITHEIRTPLTLISAPLEKIIRSNDGIETTKTNLQIIKKNTQRLLDLSNQLLDFRKTESKGFRLNFVKTDIVLWTETILQRFSPVFIQEGKLMNIILPEDHFFAYIDREAFIKIISNLLTNAMKYSEQKINFTLISPSIDNNTFSVVISNDGGLVPETETKNIFAPFYRVKDTDTRPGSGIGLSLSLSLVEFHNGKLTYQYSEDGLNQFTLVLPVEQKECTFESTTEEINGSAIDIALPATPAGKPVILIVEDQKDMRQFISEELIANYTILEAENGEEALSLLEQNTVNLIISDIVMPVMDGYELCNEIKNNIQFSHIPLVLLTAQHNLQSRLKGLNKGADAYMEKPFSLEHLSAQIENLLRNRQLIHQAYIDKPQTSATTLAISPLDDEFLQKLNTYIEINLTNQALNVEMIAIEMGMSNSSLYRKVKGLSGLSPVDFIRIIRLKKAVQLMETGEKQISEIAYQVGFSSPAYFSTCFQKQYRKTPSEYIKEDLNLL